MGGVPCAKVIINQMVAAMAVGSTGALDEVEEGPDKDELRGELMAADLDYLARCIKTWEKYGVPLPISVNPEMLAELQSRGA